MRDAVAAAIGSGEGRVETDATDPDDQTLLFWSSADPLLHSE
jgi:hypothetical protein